MTRDQRGPAPPRVGWYGDDFTGATDTLAEVSRAGLRSLLFLGVPTPQQLSRAGALDAIGIAGAARAMPPAEMQDELDAVGRFMAGRGVRVLHYKCCSTFDSAPHVGNIAAAIQALRRHMPNPLVPIVGGQPSIGRYCSFAQLFARAGGAPAIHRIDRHPVMRAHPVTPMHEADLRLHLAAQGLREIRSVPHTDYPRLRRPADAPVLEDWIDGVVESADGPLLLDLIDDEQLPVIGRLIWRAAACLPLLAVGPSSVQQALARAMPGGRAAAVDAPLAPASGPVLVVAGSLSPVTAQQIAACRRYARQPLSVQRLLSDPATPPRSRARPSPRWFRAATCWSIPTGPSRPPAPRTPPPPPAPPRSLPPPSCRAARRRADGWAASASPAATPPARPPSPSACGAWRFAACWRPASRSASRAATTRASTAWS